MRVRSLPSLALALIVLAAGAPAADEPSAQRQREIRHLLEHDCGSCHGLTRRGGLGLPLLPETLSALDDETLVAAILDGRPGTPMAPWRIELDETEARWLVRWLRRGGRDD